MTTKLPDAPHGVPVTANELPPDPMLQSELSTATGNYLVRVQLATTGGGTRFNTGVANVGALARAAVAFQSEIRLIVLGQVVDTLPGPQYDPSVPVVLDTDNADLQQVTNALLSLAQVIKQKLTDPMNPADLVRAYVLARGSVDRVLESILTFW